MQHKKLLIVLDWAPYPMSFGGNQAVFNSIEALRNDLDIYIIYPGNKEEVSGFKYKNLENAWDNVSILPFLKQKNTSSLYLFVKKLYKKVCNIIFTKNTDYLLDKELNEDSENIDEQFLQYINNIINKYHIQYVQTEFNQMLSLVNALPSNITKIFVHHEIRFVRNKLLLDKYKKSASLLYKYKVECLKTREIAFLNKYDKIITLSVADKKELMLSGVTSKIIPSFAIIKNNYVYSPSKGNLNAITFIGPEAHIPNKQGLIWFITECFPLLQNKCKNIKLRVIGNWSKKTINKYSISGKIEFLGFVDDLQNAIKDSVMIVPIMIGSGIRMKILEAAAMGVTFVTTTIGVYGMPFENMKECIIADNPNDFVNGIINCLNYNFRIKLIENAHKKYLSTYSLEKLKESRIKAYE